ncbi:MAG: hypothetical protein HRT57_09955 [Crocinitomicaceae bacterium]|nr:hypothetical protein [Crocinitomicaceae bacterium]
MNKLILLLFAGIIITSCGSDTTKPTDKPESDKPQVSGDKLVEVEKIYPQDEKFNEFSQYIAGYEGSDNSSFKGLESTASWKSYQTNLNAVWKKTNNKLPIIKNWTKQELDDANTDGGTLFYPFSGADFLHADLFFPDHDNIAMIALEPVGNYPDLVKKQKDNKHGKYLGNLKKSMNAILGLSFFRTIAMADDFQTEMDGTLHVLMHFMARTNHEVLFQEKIAIQPNGELSTDVTNITDSTYIGNRYYFKRKGENKVRTLTYFAVNIQNMAYHSRGGLVAKGLDTRSDLVAYFNGLNIKSTYLKSASYLMHRPTFSIIRNLILNESEYVLQDDSGIPVQYFDTNKWDLTFYGNFTKPISLFYERQQPDLTDIYSNKTGNMKPLPFGIGYQYVNGTSNLMKAKKK